MSCFSVDRVEVLGQQKWAVLRDKMQVRGPFETKEAAIAVLEEMESALAEAREKTAIQSTEFSERPILNGIFIGTPTFINKHYVTFNEGRNSFRILDRQPFDENFIELALGKKVSVKIKDGVVSLLDKQRDTERSR